MCRRILPLLIIGFITVTYADSVTQTDWSGGDGILGPVLDWSNEFYQAMDIDWSDYPGTLLLMRCIMEHTIDGSFNGAASVYSEDIDNDGDMDVLGAAYSANDITWWENEGGSGTSWIEHTIDGNFDGANSIYSEDIDGDGDMDVLGAARNANDITWWENIGGSGTSWAEHTVDGDFDEAWSVYAEDIDGDGDMDVLGTAFIADDITWWENVNGLGTEWTEHLIDGNYDAAYDVYSEDIDGDGDMDVLGAARDDDEITWWENNDGSGTSWTEHIVDGDFNWASSVYSEDMDGDGDMDVLGAARMADDITWWENNDGSGTSWTEHTIDGNFDQARSVYSVDIDGDGDMDVLGGGGYDISWWENEDGSGTSWIVHYVEGDLDAPLSVYSEDIDGDGNMDVLGVDYSLDFISWWDLAATFLPGGLLDSSIFDTQADTDWNYLDWNSQTPTGTSISVQVRASDDHTVMGNWSAILTAPCPLEGILNDGDRYVQYRTIFETSNPDTTPVLNDIMITWDPLGVEDVSHVTQYLLHGAVPNPAFGAVHIAFTVPELSSVKFSIFDISGRLIGSVPTAEYSPGYHSIAISDLSPGIYFCRMMSSDFNATQRLVVVR